MIAVNRGEMIQKSVVLVGAGNAHLVFLRRWRMRSVPGVAVTLVNAVEVIPYSALTPACLSGERERAAIEIDLVRLCRSAGVRLLVATVERIEAGQRLVHLAGRPPLAFDVLSLNIGASTPAVIDPQRWEGSIPLRPLSRLLDRCQQLLGELQTQPRPFHWVVVGGGASGCELAAALGRRIRELPQCRLTLVEAHERLLPRFPRAAGEIFTRHLRQLGVAIATGRRVCGGRAGELELDDGAILPCDAVVWAVPGAPPAVLRHSGLPTDAAGFLRVDPTLQVDGIAHLFAAGDCITLSDSPDLPRNGVYAVRQGPVLYDNIVAYLHGRRLRRFQPQRRCLYLLNLSDGRAVGNYGRLSFCGRWVRRWKDQIDRRWLLSFEPLPAMESTPANSAEEVAPLMRCGGCGAKVPGDTLRRVLSQLRLPDDPRVVVGLSAGEDAAVLQVTAEAPYQVQTVDYFRAFTDDPYLLGQAAAIHALSDLYAMHATPLAALAIVTVPFARGPIQEQMLRELLAGAQQVFSAESTILVGGHTTEGPELAVGFALTGWADRWTLFRKNAVRAGQDLILTKPLGTGALWAAWMRAALTAAHWRPLVEHLLVSNRVAAQLAAAAGVQACTDITGFGLAGHLLEMLDASHSAARLYSDAVPRLPGFDALAARGILSTLHPDNAKWEYRVRTAAPIPAWLFDPQTCGGLLLAVPPHQTDLLLARLRDAGYPQAAVIGQTLALEPHERPYIELL
jgi:selenide,water dikinase